MGIFIQVFPSAGSVEVMDSAKFFAQFHGLPEDIMNREFTTGNKSFRILRIEPRNPKYPIIAICKQDEKLYQFAAEVVKPLFC